MDPAFLSLALFLPRFALLYFWLNDGMPPVPMPDWFELILAVAVPRLLILFMIYHFMGICLWFFVHLLAALLVYGGSAWKAARD
jgi:hypothetical protein